MKRSILLPIFVLFFALHSSGQVAEHLLGIRFGTGGGFGTEVSYQYGLTASNRIEIDLGFNSYHDHNHQCRRCHPIPIQVNGKQCCAYLSK